jgi:hypothetical protein
MTKETCFMVEQEFQQRLPLCGASRLQGDIVVVFPKAPHAVQAHAGPETLMQKAPSAFGKEESAPLWMNSCQSAHSGLDNSGRLAGWSACV